MRIRHLLAWVERSRDLYDKAWWLETLDYHLEMQRGYVYLMHMTTTPYYKIGMSKNPEERLVTMSVELPMEIVLVHKIETDQMYNLEWDMHDYFSNSHVRGEWYNLDSDDVEYIKSIGPCHYLYVALAEEVFQENQWFYVGITKDMEEPE